MALIKINRCSCGIIHKQKEWRTAWRHAVSDGRVVSVRDEDGAQIELRAYPTKAALWNFVANLDSALHAVIVEDKS